MAKVTEKFLEINVNDISESDTTYHYYIDLLNKLANINNFSEKISPYKVSDYEEKAFRCITHIFKNHMISFYKEIEKDFENQKLIKDVIG